MRHKNAILVIRWSSYFLLFGCSQRQPSDFEGQYIYKSDELEEMLELMPNGKFRQSIKLYNNTHDASGTWSLMGNDTILFHDLLVRYNFSTQKDADAPTEFSSIKGFWNSRQKRISFDVDGNYFLDGPQKYRNVQKDAGQAATLDRKAKAR